MTTDKEKSKDIHHIPLLVENMLESDVERRLRQNKVRKKATKTRRKGHLLQWI